MVRVLKDLFDKKAIEGIEGITACPKCNKLQGMPAAGVWAVNCNFCKNVQFCPYCRMSPPHPHIKDCAKAKLEREGDKGRLDELFVLKELGRYCPSCETPQAPECKCEVGYSNGAFVATDITDLT